MIRVISFNTRVMTSNDGPNQWMYRRDAVARMLLGQRPDLLGLQEAAKAQIDDLAARLDGYGWIGIGRLGEDSGEFCPIFLHQDVLELQDHGHFWLSEQPDAPSMGWDAAYARVATWARLRHRQTGRRLLLLNTHLDNKGETARLEGAKLIRQRLANLSATTPAVVVGDFNCGPESPPYRAMTEEPGGLRDARLVSRGGHTGPVETFTGFRSSGERPAKLIDYIFVSSDLSVLRTETVPEDYDGRQLSDHRPLLADLDLGPAVADPSSSTD
jgi:endonuclease/exonuclease/phosphatase family metal-dependent hydrolase